MNEDQPLSPAAEAAHAHLRTLRLLSDAQAPRPTCGLKWEATTGSAEQAVPGIGRVKIEARKEWVERRSGMKIRHRFQFSIDGARVTEKSVYERARSL